MTLSDILLLGNPLLHKISKPVEQHELSGLQYEINGLHDLVLQFRKKYGKGRAIAAPQIGLMKRIICLNIEKPITIINPVLEDMSDSMFELWDDCMSFPNLLVKVHRHSSCILKFKDENWEDHSWELNGDMSELMQHEFDHLNGILATQRAIDSMSFKLVP